MTPYYDRAGISIYHGRAEDIVPELAGRYDHVLTDPPYGKGLRYGDNSRDTDEAFRAIVAWLPTLGVPTAFTVPSTKLFDVPRPQWIGVWHKPMSFGFWTTPFLPHWEPVCFYNLPGKVGVGDVWSCNPEKPADHPAPKPIRLWRSLLVCLAHQKTGVVLDPYMGRGTTLRAAKDLGRAAIGIDVEEAYCEAAARFLSQEVLPLEVPA